MVRTLLPPGFRFHPTDVELVMYYLKRKLLGKKLFFDAIAELNLYKFSPWDLPDKASLKTKDLEWYFFCPTERKYASGFKRNRGTETGYWKTTGRDRHVQYNGNVVGLVRSLVFHLGSAPHGKRTDWVIHEYRMEDKSLAANGVAQATYVLCKVFHKNGPGPKNGAQYGALFQEEEWNDDGDITLFSFPDCPSPLAIELQKNQNSSATPSIADLDHSPGVPLREPGPSMVRSSREDVLLDDERHSTVTGTVNPATTSGLSLREVGLSFSTHSAQDMDNGTEHVDIVHLLASLDDDPLPLAENADNEAHLADGREIQMIPNSNLNDPFCGLEDLDGLANLKSRGLNISDMAFVELDDLIAPLKCASGVGEMLSNEFYSPCNFTGSEHVLLEIPRSTFSVYDPHMRDLHQLPFGFDPSEIQENSTVVPTGHIYQPAYPQNSSNLTSYEPEENRNCRDKPSSFPL